LILFSSAASGGPEEEEDMNGSSTPTFNRKQETMSRLRASIVIGCLVLLGLAVSLASGEPALAFASSTSQADVLPEAPTTPSVETRVDKVAAASGDRGKPVPSQYIVLVKDGENPRAVAAIVSASPKWLYETALNGFTAELNTGQVNALRRLRAVESVEEDTELLLANYWTQRMDTTGQPWGLDRIDARFNEVHNGAFVYLYPGISGTYTYWSSGVYGAGYGVNAYVIDTGIATGHPDFGGRARNVYDAFGGNGQDCHGHGTHVAGTIGGAVHGVAKRVTLLGVKVLGCRGEFRNGSVGSAIAGIDWLTKNARKPAVANMSWHSGQVNATLNRATTNLINSGVFVAVSANNDNRDACYDSPSSAVGTITVAASDRYDHRAWFSNYGPCVDLYAPGVSIKSTGLSSGTYLDSGTSMASPHVAGVAALLKSNYGDRTSSTIASWILNATTTNAINANVSNTPNRLLYMYGW
jgi:subtilisin family serine protease